MTNVTEFCPQPEETEAAKTLKLRKPLMVNGEEISEIPFDFESMTVGNKLMVTKNMTDAGYTMTQVEEFGPVYHLFLFAKAAEVATKGKIITTDILRMSARDGKEAGALARSFSTFRRTDRQRTAKAHAPDHPGQPRGHPHLVAGKADSGEFFPLV